MKFPLAGLFYTILIALVLSCLGGTARAEKFLDWVEPGTEAYRLLQQGALADGSQGWVTARLNKNLRIPIGSASELCLVLLESPRVNESLKQSLKSTFPDDTEKVNSRLTSLQSLSADLKARIAAIDPMITDILETKKRNNYSPASNPQMSVRYFYTYGYGAGTGLRTHAGSSSDLTLLIGLTQNYPNASLDMGGLFVLKVPLSTGAYITGPYGGSSPGAGGNSNLSWAPYDVSSWHTTFGVTNWWDNMHFTVTLDPDWFRSLKLSVGAYGTNIDNLICAGRSGYQGSPFTATNLNPFFNGGSFVTQDLSTESTDIMPGQRGFNGFLFEKDGAQGWWIFDVVRGVFQPAYGASYADTWQADSSFGDTNVMALRLDLAHRNIWPLEDADIWAACLVTEPQKDFSVGPVKIQDDRAYSFGVTSQLWDNGQISGEYAMSNWYSKGPQPTTIVKDDLNWKDSAYTLLVSKPFMPLSFVLTYSEVGPYYVIGPRNGPWTTNGQIGNFLDSTVDDPRPINASGAYSGKVTWETIDWDSQNMSNNTRRASLNVSYVSGWGTIGINPGFATQIQPSGPWIQTARFLNNNWLEGSNWIDTMGHFGVCPAGPVYDQSGNGDPTMGFYNHFTAGPAMWNGLPYKSGFKPVEYAPTPGPRIVGIPVNTIVNWQDAQQVGVPDVFENILLSQNGLGDQNLRADSIKTMNFLRITGNLDFQTILHTEWPLTLQGYTETRAIAEQVGLATYDDKSLLAQQLSQGFLTVGLNAYLTMQGYAGYEAWLSKAGFFPLESNDFSWGWGFDVALSKFINGLNFSFRHKLMAHTDVNYWRRNWQGYALSAGAAISF